MRALRRCLGLLGTLTLAGLPAPAGAQPVGSEFQINTYTTLSQFTGTDRAIAADATGNFVVVWDGPGATDSGGVFGQRFDSVGGKLGAEFRVNSYTTGDQELASVASDADGNFVVVWDGDVYHPGIFGQRFDSAGDVVGGEFRVNSGTAGIASQPSVAADASGNFVVVWEITDGPYPRDHQVFAQRYDSAGVPRGTEFLVNPPRVKPLETSPSIASDPNGNFVVVWESTTAPGPNMPVEIMGQRYDSAGVPQGGAFKVTQTASDWAFPSVASDADGNFVVVWGSELTNRQGDVFGQRYDSQGAKRGGQFAVNSFTTALQADPSVTSDASGNFVVAWTGSNPLGGVLEIFGRHFDSAGVPQGPDFQVNSYTTGITQRASVVATGADQFVVTWASFGQDGSADGVFGQRFDFGGGDSITVESPNTNVKWRIGSMHRIQWTHNLGTDATFRIELDRDDDDNYEELIAAASPVDSATKGSFAWMVTGPRSGTARVRVAWTDDLSISDSSDVTFQIRPPG